MKIPFSKFTNKYIYSLEMKIIMNNWIQEIGLVMSLEYRDNKGKINNKIMNNNKINNYKIINNKYNNKL